MMQVENTTQLQLGDSVFEVGTLPDNIKQLVRYLDEWRSKELNLDCELLQVRAAIAHMHQVIAEQLQQLTVQHSPEDTKASSDGE